jgi:hypothetical protein
VLELAYPFANTRTSGSNTSLFGLQPTFGPPTSAFGQPTPTTPPVYGITKGSVLGGHTTIIDATPKLEADKGPRIAFEDAVE